MKRCQLLSLRTCQGEVRACHEAALGVLIPVLELALCNTRAETLSTLPLQQTAPLFPWLLLLFSVSEYFGQMRT